MYRLTTKNTEYQRSIGEKAGRKQRSEKTLTVKEIKSRLPFETVHK